MERIRRRTILTLFGGGLATSVAGCLSDGPGEPGTDTLEPTLTADGGLDREVLQSGPTSEWPTWRGDGEPAGQVRLFAAADAALGVLGQHEVSNRRRDAVESFVADTDFERERLLYVASIGPDTCHNRVGVGSLSLEEDTLVGRARAVDTSDPDEACGDAVTFPSALARVTFQGDPVDRARISVTDGWDEQSELTAVAVATDPRTLAGHVAPDGEPGTVPVGLSCDDADFRRHGTGYSGEPPLGLSTDGWGAFALRVDRLSVARGEDVSVTLTNVGPTDGSTGNRHKYNLQVRTEEGWQDVRGSADGDRIGYTDEAIIHEPGEGFEWTFTMTPEGVLSDNVHAEDLTVCPGLPAGRYRFAFWEPTVAVEFDLVK